MKSKLLAISIFVICLFSFEDTFSTTINVSVTGSSFLPPNFTAMVGDTVQWNWVDGMHTTTCDGSPSTGRPPGAPGWSANLNAGSPVFKYVITYAGSYGYKCNFHFPFMIGQFTANANPMGLSMLATVEGFWDGVSMVSDTVTALLHSSISPYNKVDSEKIKLQNTGNGNLTFTHSASGSYFVAIRHRNSIETWTKNPLTFTGGTTTQYIFTSAATQAYGDNLKFKLGRYCNFSGDQNQDGTVDVADIINIYNDVTIGASGYISTDVNGDDFADSEDLIITYNNVVALVSVIRP